MTLRCRTLVVAAAVSFVAACTESTGPAADSLLVDCRCGSISPMNPNFMPGDTLTLAVSIRRGETKVWSSSDSTVVTVSQNGLVTARKAGSALIAARSNLSGVPADTTTAFVVNGEPVPPLGDAFFSTAEEVATGKPLDLSAASGDIDLHVTAFINDPSFIRSLSMVATRPGGTDTTIATMATPTTAGDWHPTFRWSTGAKTASGAAVFPNGTYTLGLVGTYVNGTSVREEQMQIVVANP